MATYINLENLARYDLKAKARAEGLYADASAACWQKTSKAGAVTCVPAPETPLEPVVEFLFKETLPEGTKGPGNPSVIIGIASVEVGRMGKNLLVKRATSTSGIVSNSDGSYTLNISGLGIATACDSGAGGSQTPSIVRLDSSKTYTLSATFVSGTVSGNTQLSIARDIADYLILLPSSGTNSVSFQGSVFPDGKFVCRFLFNNNTNLVNAVFKLQLEEGNSVTNFDPPMSVAEINSIISLGNTFYGGTLDVASGKLTVTHRMVEPSSGTVDISDRPALLPLEFTDTYGRTVTSADGTSLDCGTSGGQIVYRLANPYTVQIDPTPIDSLPALGKTSPRVNTVYTDADSVQVGYAEHPAYTEELINNAILALGGNI